MPRTRQMMWCSYFHLGNRARRGAHAHGNPRSFKSRPGGGRSAQDAMAIADHNLSIRAQIHQPVQLVALAEIRGQNPGQEIASHEAPQAGEKRIRA